MADSANGNSMSEEDRRRTVRSYVRRPGRTTRAQRRALDTLWPRFGIDYSAQRLDLEQVFGRRAPCILEVGFGNGETLAELATAHPETDYLGVEVHEPGIGHLLLLLERMELGNVRVICHDAVEVLRHQVPPASLAGVNLFFPDPWPKKRHHKRRLVQAAFVELVARALEPAGSFHLATDWQDYAEHMLEVVDASPRFHNCSPEGGFAASRGSRPSTKFEWRGRRLGHQVRDLVYRRT